MEQNRETLMEEIKSVSNKHQMELNWPRIKKLPTDELVKVLDMIDLTFKLRSN